MIFKIILFIINFLIIKKMITKIDVYKRQVNTVTELNEVNKVKFLVNGQASGDFEEFYVRK